MKKKEFIIMCFLRSPDLNVTMINAREHLVFNELKCILLNFSNDIYQSLCLKIVYVVRTK